MCQQNCNRTGATRKEMLGLMLVVQVAIHDS